MHPQVQKLLALQQLDQKIAVVKRHLDSVPAETARRKKVLEQFRADAEARERDLQQAEVASREIDLATRQADEEIRKLEARLNTVKNNAEYQATLLQIESVKAERDRQQEDGLGLLDRIESLRAARDESRTRLAGEQGIFDGYLKEAEVVLRERQAELDKVSSGRAAMLEQIPPDLLERYDKLFRSRDHLAVCAVEAKVCQGCYMNVTMNDVARLQGGSSIVQCGSCDRILYLAEQA